MWVLCGEGKCQAHILRGENFVGCPHRLPYYLPIHPLQSHGKVDKVSDFGCSIARSPDVLNTFVQRQELLNKIFDLQPDNFERFMLINQANIVIDKIHDSRMFWLDNS